MGRQGFEEEGEDEGAQVIECVEGKGEGCDEKEKSESGVRKVKNGGGKKNIERGEQSGFKGMQKNLMLQKTR